MSPVDSRLALLAAEVRRDWKQVARQLSIATATDLDAGLAAHALVALSLDHAYQAFETILLRLERGLGLPERQGAQWHAELLDAATMPLVGVRPVLVEHAAAAHWRQLMAFRHFLRHAYAVDLDPAKLAANLEALQAAVRATDAPLTSVLGTLEAPAGS
jgi:hypothetical protein